ncbi:MAG TPA: SPW repeat protein [Vicinamibacterales bacterium]|jgi:hypothetical protein
MKWASWVLVIFGIWLIIAPFVLGYSAISAAATTEDVILGVVILILSLWSALAVVPPAGISWILLLLGIWVLIAPFVVGYAIMSGTAMGNDVVMGILTIVFSLIGALTGTPRTIVETPRPPA